MKRFTSPTGRKVIGYLIAFALGALVHDATVGGRMWAYHEAQAQAEAQASELAFVRNALAAREQVNVAEIQMAKLEEGRKTPEQRSAEAAETERKYAAERQAHPVGPDEWKKHPVAALPPATD